MVSSTLAQHFGEFPEHLLALSLSAAHHTPRRRSQSVTIEFEGEHTVARVRRETQPAAAPLRLLATKRTIAAAILMHHLLVQRGPNYEQTLINRAREFAHSAAESDVDAPPEFALNLGQQPYQGFADSAYFAQTLDVSAADYEIVTRKTIDAFNFLEAENLVVDPAFTPEVMVLLGFLPMHFSVRTPKGERILRQIRINAPLWYVDVSRGMKNGQPFTDFEFKFRGIGVVRAAITAMAKEYLDSERDARRKRGKSVLNRKGSPDLDGGSTEENEDAE